MRIGILGAGAVGTGLGRRLAQAGHEICVGFSRTPESLAAAAETIGAARTAEPAEVARHGEVVILATPWAATLPLVRALSDELAGRIVWDTTNPMTPDMRGLELGLTTSAGEAVARAAPLARVVKAIAPFAEVLHSPSTLIGGRRPGVFVCSDDGPARAAIWSLVEDIGADGVDAGPLSLARYTEPLGMLLVQLAYVQGRGARIGAQLIAEPPAPAGSH